MTAQSDAVNRAPSPSNELKMSRLLLRVRPGEYIFASLLVVTIIWTAIALPGKPELSASLFQHLGLLGGFCLLVGWSVVKPSRLTRALPFIAMVFLISVLYTSLGLLGFELHGGGYDHILSGIDTWIFGTDPALVIQHWTSPGWTEFLSIIYLFFLLYIYLSMILGCAAFQGQEREAFLLGISLNWTLAFFGYLLVPAGGPIGYHADHFTVMLEGGPAFDQMMKGFWDVGGAIGAFPSLHVGGTFFFCAFDWRKRPFRGMTYTPILILITISTVYLRFHYIIDWFAGIAVALSSLWAAPRITAWWTRRAEAAQAWEGR
jgi:hypothetical protein